MSLHPPRICSFALVGALTLVVGACSGDEEAAGPTATLGTAPPTTTTTLGVDQVPNQITVEYVQRVVDELDESWGAMFRQYKADGGPTPDNLAWLAEIYAEPAYTEIERSLGEFAADNFDGARANPGSPDTRVEEVVDRGSGCVLVEARRTLDEVLEGPPLTDEEAASRLVIAARPTDERKSERNPSAWKVMFDGGVDDPAPEACS